MRPPPSLRAREARGTAALLAPAYLWLTAAVFLPLGVMLGVSFLTETPFGGREWAVTLGQYEAALGKPLYRELLRRSLLLAGEVTLWCVVIGWPAAFVLAKVIGPRRRGALFLLTILPFWSNGLVRVFSWAILLRGDGVIDRAVEGLTPLEVEGGLLFTREAVVIGLVHAYLPYVVLTGYLSISAIGDDLLEAARSLGASRRLTFLRVVAPLSLPGVAAGAALIFVPVAGAFMEPRILGGREGTFLGTVIEDQFTAVFNWPFGAALSFVLLAAVLAVLAVSAPAVRAAR